ncbi:hypothetical protein BV898_01365 [Hypsibius exemplaris]|uniref:BPTI/Kunitz inhibitor domain-containing protein n=1 Tax=Hypsibius exemplaris TaxID=2072580 RepID=A0A1W0XBH0_HYPEX|nr:hypothetical protein BV898_01365 [Hypsibius exemplaris]
MASNLTCEVCLVSLAILLIGVIAYPASDKAEPGTTATLPRPKDCTSPPETGPCKAAFENYYFNTTLNKCMDFIYGGCEGNGNRYATEEECNDACALATTVSNAL